MRPWVFGIVLPGLCSAAAVGAAEHPFCLWTKEQAARAIGKMGPAAKEAIPALIAALNEKVRLGNKAIPEGLAGIGTDALPAVLQAMKSGDPYVRSEAIAAVRILGPAAKDAVPALAGALEDENRAVQISACMALAALGSVGADAAPSLKRRLGDPIIGKHAELALNSVAPAQK